MNHGAHVKFKVSVTIYPFKTTMTHLQYEDKAVDSTFLCTRLYFKD